MPARYIVKQYVENSYYHIYNRGVEKRNIFLEKQDCAVFLHYLKLYLSPKEELRKFKNKLKHPSLRINRFISLNLENELDLVCFSLMPNHIHLLIKQYTKDAIIKFMRRLSTSYVMYFNRKYRRVGALFQSAYKAVLIKNDEYLLHLSRYIHLNPFECNSGINFVDLSSYPYYLGKKKASWINSKIILDYFKSVKKSGLRDIMSYQSFVEDYEYISKEFLGNLVIE